MCEVDQKIYRIFAPSGRRPRREPKKRAAHAVGTVVRLRSTAIGQPIKRAPKLMVVAFGEVRVIRIQNCTRDEILIPRRTPVNYGSRHQSGNRIAPLPRNEAERGDEPLPCTDVNLNVSVHVHLILRD